MKRQLLRTKSGFTLFELMIVITIFGALLLTTSMFDYTPQTEVEKADRMVVSIGSILKTELQNIFIGRMPNRDGMIASTIRINIGTGGLTTRYYSGTTSTNPFISSSFLTPFFDGDDIYEIKSVVWTGSSSVTSGYSGSGELILEPTAISFSGAGITGSGYSILEIKVGYQSRSRKVILDRRTGKISEIKVY